MIKAIIVEDEPKSRENLQILLSDFCKNVAVVGMAATVKEGLALIDAHQPDVVFLDIHMHKETGFDLLNQLPAINFEIIFTTAYSEYALEAIKFAAVDYLLKPIDIAELQNAVMKVEKKLEKSFTKERFELLLQNFRLESSEDFKIALPSSNGLIFVNLRDILYCEAMSNYTYFYMKGGQKYLVSRTLKDYETLLEKHFFFRIHHSYLINLREVTQYIRGDGGYVLLPNGIQLDVSKRRKDAFLRKIAETNLL